MRKALIAVVVAAGLFAVGAFAADFALTSDDIASGADQVDACATSATVDYTTTPPDTTNPEYLITVVDITFTEATPGDCQGATVDASLGLDSTPDTNDVIDNWQDIGCSNVDGGASTCTGLSVSVSEVEEIAVLVSGVVVPTA